MMASAYSASPQKPAPMVMASPAMGPASPAKFSPDQPYLANSSGGTAVTNANCTSTKMMPPITMVPITEIGMLRAGFSVSPASWMAWLKPNSEKNTPAVEIAVNMLATLPLACAGTVRFPG